MNALGKNGNKRALFLNHYLFTILLDRGWGKPLQHNENVNLGMTYIEYLEMVTKQENEERIKSVEVRYSVEDL